MLLRRVAAGVLGLAYVGSACSGANFSSAGSADQGGSGSGNGSGNGGNGAPIAGRPTSNGGGATDGGAVGSDAGATSPPVGEAGAPTTSSCEDEVAPTDAVYVSQALGNDSAPGTSNKPLATLGAAIAQASGRVIVVDWGEYQENQLQVGDGAEVTIRGGYQAAAAGPWSRACGDFPTRTKVLLPAGLGMQSAGDLTLDGLAFEQAPPQASSGNASIALFVSAGSFRAVNVAVAAAPGSSGAVPSKAGAGAAGTAQLAGCKDGKDGLPGEPGSKQLGWSFSASGFEPGTGEDGKIGTKGAAGTAGHAAASRSDCVSCQCTNACSPTQATVSVGAATCGEGGEPGLAGNGGRGGGASVALLLGPGVTLELDDVTLVADEGGVGSAGSQGGDGGPGAEGAAGQNHGACCRAGCAIEGDGKCGTGGCYVTPYLGNATVGACPADRVLSSPAGGKGGRGGNGGKGESGPAGPSFALVRSAADVFDIPVSVSLRFAGPAPDSNHAEQFAY